MYWRVFDERQSDVTEQVVETQTRGALDGISADDAQGITLAYEPVWAIGTGLTATPEQAEAVHAFSGRYWRKFMTTMSRRRFAYNTVGL